MNMRFNKKLVALPAASIMLLAACAGGGTTDTGGTTSTGGGGDASGGQAGKVEVFSWWTSGSEDAALQAIFAEAVASNPDLEFVNAAVAGGAGTNAKQVLATRLSGGDAPEIWQTHPGGELGDYVDQGVVVGLNALYEAEGWFDVVPKGLVDSMSYDGEVYSVLSGVHRGNVIWINKAAMEDAGVSLSGGISWSDFAGAAAAMRDNGISPVCLGDKDIWTAAQLLEAIIVGEIGAAGWDGLLDGSKAWSDANVQTAVGNFLTAMEWVNPDHKALDWTGAVDALAAGTCGMNVMGDWAYGELLVKHGFVDGEDFTYAHFGNASDFVTVGDSFVVGVGSNEDGGLAFLKAIMDPAVQIAFNQLKGSAPVRSDVDLSSLGAYQQGAAQTLSSGTQTPSLVHGQALVAAAVGQAYAEAVTLLQANGDVAAFAAAMDAATANN